MRRTSVGRDLAEALVASSRCLSKAVARLRFAPPVHTVYNPLDYARAAHEQYLRRFGAGEKEIVFVGMNPGPFGMAQTGVPFGDVAMVRDFLGIEAEVERPAREHPKRPIEGFACARSEVSGTRLWGWVKTRFGRPEAFFARAFVHNYCPLCFVDEGGKNLTPDKLPVRERRALEVICDAALRQLVSVLQPTWVLGIGAFAEARAKQALLCNGGTSDTRVRIGTILHPSPASPAANRGWAAQAEAQLRALGILFD